SWPRRRSSRGRSTCEPTATCTPSDIESHSRPAARPASAIIRGMTRLFILGALPLVLLPDAARAGGVTLRIERRETVLAGRSFGSAGPYERLVGKVVFA